MVFFPFVRRNEREGLADDFLGGPPKDSFGGWIPERDLSGAFQRDDRQRRGGDNGAELLEGGAQSFFEVLSLVDIFGVAVPPYYFACCIVTRFRTRVHPAICAVRYPDAMLHVERLTRLHGVRP